MLLAPAVDESHAPVGRAALLVEKAEEDQRMDALGIGPVGGAFYAWDIGMKRGDIRLLGVCSYAAPVLSTLALVLAGYADATISLALACALIVAGALLATFAGRRVRA